MAKQFEDCLRQFQLTDFTSDWGAIARGIEKECLRVTPEGYIARSSHPPGLGSALTNPYITTDFSEALLEFITPVNNDIDECLTTLDNIHRFTYQNLEFDELLWVASMPCPKEADGEIPLARYGSSNIGQLKTLYRKGLSHRYGSLMQAIAGIHYNFSMPESFWPAYQEMCKAPGSIQQFRTEKYLHLIRNFHRYSWLLIYLFGASPAACKCFVKGRDHRLEYFDDNSLYLPFATCLRMSNLGYKSDAQKSLFVCYNELDSYVDCLQQAMHTPYSNYEKIGQKSNGEYLQINTNLLQLENEFYSTIRPKRVALNGERPLSALTSQGIEYIEVRALDLNPFLPLGIDKEQIQFLDAFLLYCLLSESPACNEREYFEVASNITAVVEQGRNPELDLSLEGKQINLKRWAGEILQGIEFSAGLLDQAHNTSDYSNSVAAQKTKVDDPALTPSGKILTVMEEQKISFYEFTMQQSMIQKNHFAANGLSPDMASHMEHTSVSSVHNQLSIEAADVLNFDEFLLQWNAS